MLSGRRERETALDIVLDKCDVLVVRITSLDVYCIELNNVQQEEAIVLQTLYETRQQEVNTVRREFAD